MKQAVPKRFGGKKKIKRKVLPKKVQKYGTSKLEADFASEFLDKYGLVYIYQYEAKEIGRFFDFAVTAYRDKGYIMEEKDGINCVRQDGQFFDVAFFIEVDGDYWHVHPEKFKDKELTPTQKHNLSVDRQKDKYAALRCIPLVRIWEDDIRNNKKKVIEELKKYVNLGEKKKLITENRKKPH